MPLLFYCFPLNFPSTNNPFRLCNMRKRKLLVYLLVCISSELRYLQAAKISELVEADLECSAGLCKLGSISVETNRKSQELLGNKGSSGNINVNANQEKEVTISKSTEKIIRLTLKPFFTVRKFISKSLASFFGVSGGCVRSFGYITLRISEACDSVITSVFQSAPPILMVIIYNSVFFSCFLLQSSSAFLRASYNLIHFLSRGTCNRNNTN